MNEDEILCLYLVERTDEIRYNEYDSFICIAKDKEEARNTHPEERKKEDWNKSWIPYNLIDTLKVTCIGINTTDLGKDSNIILRSFNAGKLQLIS